MSLNTTHISFKAWVKCKIFLLTIILIPKNQREPMVTAIQVFSHVYEGKLFVVLFAFETNLCIEKGKYAKTQTRFFTGVSIADSQDSLITVSLFKQQYQSQRATMKISCQSLFHHSISFALLWSTKYHRMKCPIFKVKFPQKN